MTNNEEKGQPMENSPRLILMAALEDRGIKTFIINVFKNKDMRDVKNDPNQASKEEKQNV